MTLLFNVSDKKTFINCLPDRIKKPIFAAPKGVVSCKGA
jgi:hypothetical protein